MSRIRNIHPALSVGLSAAIWLALYVQLEPLSKWLAGFTRRLISEPRLVSAVEFFLYEVPKVLLLLIAVVFVVGILRTYVSPARTRQILGGRREFSGNVLAAVFGIFTPFCSCSAVPLFLGMLESGVPLGVTFSFLISAPMINEIALVLLFEMFGWKVALIYVVAGLSVAISAGWVIGKLNMERYLEAWALPKRRGLVVVRGEVEVAPRNITERVLAGRDAVQEILSQVWIYLVAGIAVGAMIHGYVPSAFIAGIMGQNTWWSVPFAVLLGVPLYSNAAGIIPVVHALLEKGASFGTVLAFMMAVIALSLPEMIILRKVLKVRLLATFVGVVACGIILVGYLFNAIL